MQYIPLSQSPTWAYFAIQYPVFRHSFNETHICYAGLTFVMQYSPNCPGFSLLYILADTCSIVRFYSVTRNQTLRIICIRVVLQGGEQLERFCGWFAPGTTRVASSRRSWPCQRTVAPCASWRSVFNSCKTRSKYRWVKRR